MEVKQHPQIPFANADGTTNKMTVFEPEDDRKKVIALFPAMGVKASYYHTLGAALARQGFTVVLTDLRGNGHSSIRPSRKVDFGYNDQLEQEFTSVKNHIFSTYVEYEKYLVGHSLGGQLGALFVSRENGWHGLAVIACCSVYHKTWGKGKTKLMIATHIITTVSKLLGYYPGKRFGFGGLEAKTVMLDWAKQARTGLYFPKGNDRPYEELMAKTTLPVLAVSFVEDDMAPKSAVDHLLGKFGERENIEHLRLDKSETGKPFNHFNWAKQPEKVVEALEKWISGKS